jgi:uncharacterized delta-60 repeat protein
MASVSSSTNDPLPVGRVGRILWCVLLGWLNLATTLYSQTPDDSGPITDLWLLPVTQLVDPGQAIELGAVAFGGIPQSHFWLKDGALVATGASPFLTLTNSQRSDAGHYQVVGTNRFGASTSAVATVCVNLAAVSTFSPTVNNELRTMAFQPDGKLLVGGRFTALNLETHRSLGRFNTDGSVDWTFQADVGGDVRCLAVQEDGQILVGGLFTNLAGVACANLGRLHLDGSIDPTFTPRPSGIVECLALQPDGKILLGGSFNRLANQSCFHLGRLNADGTLDPSFDAGISSLAGYEVRSLALQTNGQILVGGLFSRLGYEPWANFGRLQPNGTLDTGFQGQTNDPILRLAVLPDGKILASGGFTNLYGQTLNGLARFDQDGRLDASFQPPPDQRTGLLGVQTDGRILVMFFGPLVDGNYQNRVARLNPDGSLDVTFGPSLRGSVAEVALRSDGSLILAGDFVSVGGHPRARLAAINNTEPTFQELSFANSTASWHRTGVGQEFWRASFAVSTNGADWTDLGPAQRIADGWQRTGLVLSSQATLRARGFVAAGSSWFVESMLGPPGLTDTPQAQALLAGATASFHAFAGGSPPLFYQWYKDGIPLVDSQTVFGSQISTLVLSNVLGGDAGQYTLVVSNALGIVTTGADLSVTDPHITGQPASRSGSAGGSIQLLVGVVGTQPLAYQWRKNGADLPGATEAALVLPRLQPNQAGIYQVLVTNVYGALTSSSATVAVNVVTVDDTFAPNSDTPVLAFAEQPDGGLLAGGAFARLAGQKRLSLGRFDPVGSLDDIFNPGASSTVSCFAVQPDGQILVGGAFSTLAGRTNRFLGRLHPDGTADTSFRGSASPSGNYVGPVYALALQTDGKILVGGRFGRLNTTDQPFLGRLDPQGNLDPSFKPVLNGAVYSLALQPDSKILIAGEFARSGPARPAYIGRLLSDGTVDPAFLAIANAFVRCVALQPDGKILAGGEFTQINGQERLRIARLHPDGSLDLSFNPGASGPIHSIVLQADGGILTAGNFLQMGGLPRGCLARLAPDGTLDPFFFPNVSASVIALALQTDGRILVGGEFTRLNGLTRNYIGRFKFTHPATEQLALTGSNLTWLRGGTAPEVWRTTFELSTDGSTWTALGVGSRVQGGWELMGVSVPTNALIRVRGYITGGQYNSSSWFAESLLGVGWSRPPVIYYGDGDFGFTSNRFGFHLKSGRPDGVVIEASQDLRFWTPIATNRASSTPFYFADPASKSLPRRFYRAR